MLCLWKGIKKPSEVKSEQINEKKPKPEVVTGNEKLGGAFRWKSLKFWLRQGSPSQDLRDREQCGSVLGKPHFELLLGIYTLN